MRVVGYIRVSTDGGSNSGAGLEVERLAVTAAAEKPQLRPGLMSGA